MVEPGGDRYRMHASDSERGRVRVAEIIQADRWQIEFRAQGRQSLRRLLTAIGPPTSFTKTSEAGAVPRLSARIRSR